MQKIKKDAIFLIDGSSFLYRAYYALRPLHTSKGVPVQATYGFCRTIKKLIDDFDPQRIALVWDSKGKTFRNELYEEYKATRQAPPSDLFVQKEQIQEFAKLIGLCQIAQVGVEADDLIASVAADFKEAQIILISPDKDLHQLISNRVIVYDPFKKEFIDRDRFIERHGFSPEHLLLYHSLLGDPSDNIPGVRGIGKKGAQELVVAFKTLDNLYNNLDKVEKERMRKALQEQKKEAFLSEKLFKLRQVKTKITQKDLVFDKKHLKNAAPLFKELEFKTLLKAFAPKEAVKALQEKKEAQQAIFEAAEKGDWDCVVVRDDASFSTLLNLIKRKRFFAYDTETTGVDPLSDELVGISFAVDDNVGYYVPVGHVLQEGEEQLDREYVLEQLKPIFESDCYEKTVHHGKFDQLILWQYGIEVRGVVFDSLIVAHLLRKDPWQKVGLKFLSKEYLDEPMMTFAQVMGKQYKTFNEVPIERGSRYAAHDALQTYKLKFVLEKGLNREPKLKKLFRTMELPLNRVLVKMERYGIMLDPTVLGAVEKEVEKEIAKIERKIFAAIGYGEKGRGEQINLNSPQQLEVLLFDELGLPVIKLSPEGRRSTDHEVLTELSKTHPIPGLILKYRELFKLKSTYLQPLPEQINPKTKRIHTTFGQTYVVTGRLSSSNPNLQNIPVDTGYGRRVREAFVAPRGRRFLSADYSQIDLRVLAHLSKDQTLTKAFLEDRDIHAQTASEIFGVSIDAVEPDQRQIGKRINFSIIYGLTPYGLSRELGIKPAEAKEYIDTYFAQYPKVAQWMDVIVENAKKTGYVETLFGRRRYVPGLQEKNRTLYEQARRIAVNTPVQGTTADVIKLAMIKLDEVFTKKKLDAQMLIQIHDELIIEFHKDHEGTIETLVHQCMEKIVDWKVPLKVAVRIGKNWAEVTK